MTSLERLVNRVATGMAIMVGLLTAVIMLIVVADVASRFVLGRAIQNADETSILLLIALIYLGFAGAQAQEQNFSVDILVRVLSPRLRASVDILASIVAILVCLVMAYYSWLSAIDSVLKGEMTYGVSYFPVWPTRIIIAIGYSMLAVQFLVQIAGRILRLVTRSVDGEHVGPSGLGL